MAEQTVKVCIDRVLPEELEIEAMERAIEERPDNLPIAEPGTGGPPAPKELALMTRKLWRPGRTLRVRFLGGNPVVQEKIEEYAHLWSEHANISFSFGDDANAEIRIGFADAGSWSYIGTDALTIAKNRPTMNYGWLTPNSDEEEYSRVVVHEFGHALGCIHEHQNPAGGIPWNEDAVYEYYERRGWDRQRTFHNLLRRYEADETQFSAFDPDSIMLYPVPNELTNGNFEVGWNRHLSETDKAFIRHAYPFDGPRTIDLVVDADPIVAGIGEGGDVDHYRFMVTEPGRYLIETTGNTDIVMGLFGPNSRTAQIMRDDDSGERLNPRISTLLQRGLYYLRVHHYRGDRTGDYNISVRRQGDS